MRLSIVAIFLAFPAVLAECPAGSTATASAADTTCVSSAASCQSSSCCTQDPNSCKATSLNCPTGQFKDSAKNGNTAGTTDTDKQTNCCSAKATCSAYTCAAGYTATASAADTTCTGSVASCAYTSSCCTQDPNSCKATSLNCPTGQFKDSAKNGATAGTTDTDKQTNCCSAKATCSAYTLPATASPSKSPTLVPTKVGDTLVPTKEPTPAAHKCRSTTGQCGGTVSDYKCQPSAGCSPIGSDLTGTKWARDGKWDDGTPDLCVCKCEDIISEERSAGGPVACSGTALFPTLSMMLFASTAAILGQKL